MTTETKNTWIVTAAGSLQIAAFLALAIFLSFYLMFGIIYFIYYPIQAAVNIVFGLLVLVGGINSFRKKSWIKSLVGSVSILFAYFPFLSIQVFREHSVFLIVTGGFLLIGIVSTLLVILSKDRFQSNRNYSDTE